MYTPTIHTLLVGPNERQWLVTIRDKGQKTWMSEVLDWVFSSIKELLINHGTNSRNLTPCSVWHPRILSSPCHLNNGTQCQLPVWLALAPLRYRCWSPCTAAITYPDICLGGLLPIFSSLMIWDYIPCVLSIYGMNWVPASMLAFLPELSFYNVIRKHCSLEYPDHKPENIKVYVNPWIIPNGCMKCNFLSNIYINHW